MQFFSKSITIAVSNNVYQGVQYMVMSVAAFTIMNILVKSLQQIPPFELVFFRSIGSFLICTTLIFRQGIPILGNKKWLLASRGLVGMTAMVTFFWAIKLLPFASAISLRYLSPIFAALIAIFLLKEKITLLQWFCFLMAFLGVLLLKGFDIRVSLFGLAVIVCSAILSGVVYVIIRYIGNSEHPLVIVNYFMFTATVIGFIVSLFNWVTPQGKEWIFLLSLGIFGFFGQLFMTKAYQIAYIGSVAPVKYLESVFALFVGWLWFGETYTMWALVGLILIVGGMLLNIFAKQQ